MARKIPATVVTGFLGAGKTTLVRHLLTHAHGRRIALIVNEFGELGVDGEILRGCGIENCADEDVVELANGCICCTVADDFLPAMTALLDRPNPPEHIVIETSGLALPQPLIRAFNWPEVRNRLTVDGVVVVVDGPAVAAGRFAADEAKVDAQREADDSIDHETPLSELFEDQLACADMIVVNKADLMDGGAPALAAALRARARRGVQVIEASMGAVDPAVLLGLGIGAEGDMEARHELHHHHHHDDDDDDHDDDHDDHEHEHGHDEFESFSVDLPELPDPAAFQAAVSETIAAHDLLRVKGFCAVSGKPLRLLLQAVGPRVDAHYDRPFAGGEARATRLVVIGLAGIDQTAVTAAFQAAARAQAA